MTILFYCLAIAFASLLGGYLPLAKRISHLSLQVYLGLSAGAMLGAACFHMLPEGAELAGRSFGLWLIFGIVGLYVIERFLSPHSHASSEDCNHTEGSGNKATAAGKNHAHEEDDHAVSPHAHFHPAAPRVAGWSAVAGLSIHTLLGGVALGSAVLQDSAPRDLGLAVFLATVLHKPADSLTISTLLIKGGTPRSVTAMVQVAFAMLIPLGVILFFFGRSLMTTHLDSAFTGSVLAFSAGTFICIALSDLLPEVQFHSHDRIKLFLAVILGAALMWGTALLESRHHLHEHEHQHEKAHLFRSGDELDFSPTG